MRTTNVFLLALATVVGCSAGVKAPSVATHQPPAASTGQEATPEPSEPPPAAVELARELDQSAIPQGPATLTVVADVAGKPVAAHVQIFDEQGTIKAEGSSGDALTLPAGAYKLEISIRDAAVMADKPTQVRDLRLEPGPAPKLEAHFSWAKVQLDVRVNGRSQPGAMVQLLRNGEQVAELKSGAAPVPITPGRYEADVLLKGTKIRVQGLQFPDSATQVVPVNVRF